MASFEPCRLRAWAVIVDPTSYQHFVSDHFPLTALLYAFTVSVSQDTYCVNLVFQFELSLLAYDLHSGIGGKKQRTSAYRTTPNM